MKRSALWARCPAPNNKLSSSSSMSSRRKCRSRTRRKTLSSKKKAVLSTKRKLRSEKPRAETKQLTTHNERSHGGRVSRRQASEIGRDR